MRRLLLILALLFLAAHLRSLPHTLEDIDSINFAMGVESFDVAKHQPHPPGYPVYIGLARISTTVLKTLAPGWDRDRRAAAGLVFWSVLSGALAVLVVAGFWRALGLAPPVAATAAIVTVTAPLFWFTSVRPLSDVPGLVAAIAVQTWCLRGLAVLRAGATRGLPSEWSSAAFAAGLIIGLRSQTLLLTAPLLLWAVRELLVRRWFAEAARLVGVAAVGALLWAIPLVWDSGGFAGYVRALGGQGQQDFANVTMLATVPSARLLQLTARRTFIDPWHVPTLAHVALVLAAVGVWVLIRRHRPALTALVVAFVPYLLFHFFFQETVFIRYSLPAVIPVAGLAVAGLSAFGVRVAMAGGVVLAIASLVIVQPRIDAYALNPSPEFAVFREMQQSRLQLSAAAPAPLIRTHHQVWHVVRRTMDWYRPYWDLGPQPFPGDREWLDLVRYWNGGGTAPVWLLGDLSRNDVRLFDWRSTALRERYALDPRVRQLMGGVRIDGLNWWVLDRPRWMLGTGWSLTPEIAGMASKDGNGPHQRPAEGFLSRDRAPLQMLIGARYLQPGGAPALLTVALDGRTLAEWPISPASPWLVSWIDLPAGVPEGSGPYAALTLTVRSTESGRPAPMVGLEQFDAAPASAFTYAFLDDWNELEGNPRTGELWRWTTARSTILIHRGDQQTLQLRLEGESPLREFDRAPTIVVKAGDRELARFSPSTAYTQQIGLPADALDAAGGRVTIETDLTFVPGDRRATADRRRLGLRLFRVDVR